LQLASAAELLHSATLLHDDVIDEAVVRRGRPCARIAWGNTVSVIAGDLLLVHALDRVHAIGDRRLDSLMDCTLRQLVEAEVDQLDRRGAVHIDQTAFEDIALRKTSSLFVLAAVGGALLGGANGEQADRVQELAIATGLAFQLDDDLLDLCGSAEALGKAVGQDLATGSITLPMADVLSGAPDLREMIDRHLSHGDGPLPVGLSEELLALARRPGTLDRARGLVAGYLHRAMQALAGLRACEERDVLECLIRLLGVRAFGTTMDHETTRSVS
jgi:octaprenyl-diphosphate synthase